MLTPEEEAIVVAFRRHTLLPLDDCLYGLQPTIPHLTRSSLHRCLERHGISRLPEMEGDKPKTKRFADYAIGYMHIDIADDARAECMGRSRGGLTTKIHALLDANGPPVVLKLRRVRSGPRALWNGRCSSVCRFTAPAALSPSIGGPWLTNTNQGPGYHQHESWEIRVTSESHSDATLNRSTEKRLLET